MNGIAETVPIVYKTGKLDRANRVWPRSETCAFGALAVVLGGGIGFSAWNEWDKGMAPLSQQRWMGWELRR